MVVTGAGGFIGAAVCRALVSLGCEIHALVSKPAELVGAPIGIAREMRAEITDKAALSSLLEGQIDAVIHLAGPPSVRASFENAFGYADAHTGGTAALLDVCKRKSVEKIVYVSSAEVYGQPRTNPVDESHPLEARSPYAAAKIGAEQMLRAHDHAYGTSSAIIRPFSVYGEGMGKYALISSIIGQLADSHPIRLTDMRPERDYCHVDDVARAITIAAHTVLMGTLAINIGSGVGTSVGELTRMILHLASSDRAIEQIPGEQRPGNSDILRLIADTRQAAQTLAWKPLISLERGLQQMLHASVKT